MAHLNIKTGYRAIFIFVLFLVFGSALRAGPIHDSAKAGNLAKIRELIAANPTLVDARDARGCTPLFYAVISSAEDQHVELAKLLLQEGAAIDAKNDMGYTPLMFAVAWGGVDVVRFLLGKGANPNAEVEGLTALMLAKNRNGMELSQLLLESGAKGTQSAQITVNRPLQGFAMGAIPLAVFSNERFVGSLVNNSSVSWKEEQGVVRVTVIPQAFRTYPCRAYLSLTPGSSVVLTGAFKAGVATASSKLEVVSMTRGSSTVAAPAANPKPLRLSFSSNIANSFISQTSITIAIPPSYHIEKSDAALKLEVKDVNYARLYDAKINKTIWEHRLSPKEFDSRDPKGRIPRLLCAIPELDSNGNVLYSGRSESSNRSNKELMRRSKGVEWTDAEESAREEMAMPDPNQATLIHLLAFVAFNEKSRLINEVQEKIVTLFGQGTVVTAEEYRAFKSRAKNSTEELKSPIYDSGSPTPISERSITFTPVVDSDGNFLGNRVWIKYEYPKIQAETVSIIEPLNGSTLKSIPVYPEASETLTGLLEKIEGIAVESYIRYKGMYVRFTQSRDPAAKKAVDEPTTTGTN